MAVIGAFLKLDKSLKGERMDFFLEISLSRKYVLFSSAAGLNEKSIFTQSTHDSLGDYSRKLEWSNGTGSDLFVIYNAYKVWTFKHHQYDFGITRAEQRQAEKSFGQKHCIEIGSMHDRFLLVRDLKTRLEIEVYNAFAIEVIADTALLE